MLGEEVAEVVHKGHPACGKVLFDSAPLASTPATTLTPAVRARTGGVPETRCNVDAAVRRSDVDDWWQATPHGQIQLRQAAWYILVHSGLAEDLIICYSR